jgi:hypothetical protein
LVKGGLRWREALGVDDRPPPPYVSPVADLTPPDEKIGLRWMMTISLTAKIKVRVVQLHDFEEQKNKGRRA